jgi:hypothetical protein
MAIQRQGTPRLQMQPQAHQNYWEKLAQPLALVWACGALMKVMEALVER